MWNNQEHVEAYFAVPCKGSVLHTLNIRLSPEQLAYVIKDGGDKAIMVDDSLVPLLAQVKDDLGDVEHIIVVGDGDASALGRDVVRYDELLADQTAGYEWPEVDENDAVMMCYTSGTTGNPKGVVYSHRSQWTHTMGAAAGGLHVPDGDRGADHRPAVPRQRLGPDLHLLGDGGRHPPAGASSSSPSRWRPSSPPRSPTSPRPSRRSGTACWRWARRPTSTCPRSSGWSSAARRCRGR